MDEFLDEAFGHKPLTTCKECGFIISGDDAKQREHMLWRHPTEQDISNTRRSVDKLAGKVKASESMFDLAYYSAKLTSASLLLKAQTEAFL